MAYLRSRFKHEQSGSVVARQQWSGSLVLAIIGDRVYRATHDGIDQSAREVAGDIRIHAPDLRTRRVMLQRLHDAVRAELRSARLGYIADQVAADILAGGIVGGDPCI